MVKHNNVVPFQHFHKDWDKYVKVWTDQAGRKKRRRVARQKKALAVAPRPLGLLRPVAHGQTTRYNQKLKVGRGFSLQELKEAKVPRTYAKQVGIAVDHRRVNKSAESVKVNVQRLKEYMAKLVVYKKQKKSAPKTEQPTVAQYKGRVVLPFKTYNKEVEVRTITEEERKFSAYETLRRQYADARNVGKNVGKEDEDK